MTGYQTSCNLVKFSTASLPTSYLAQTKTWVKKKIIPHPQLAPCLQSSVFSPHIHLQSSLWNAPTLTFWSSLSVHLQSAAGSVLQHVGLDSQQREQLSKGVRVLLAGLVTIWTLHSTAECLKKKNQLFPLYCCPTLSYFHPTETKIYISLCLFPSFVSPGNIDLIWAKLWRCHLAKRKRGLDKDWREKICRHNSEESNGKHSQLNHVFHPCALSTRWKEFGSQDSAVRTVY